MTNAHRHRVTVIRLSILLHFSMISLRGECPLDLSEIKIASVISHKRNSVGMVPLIALHETTPLSMALAVLREHGFESIPVYKMVQDGKEYTGIVSVFDIVSFTVFQRLFDDLE